MITRFQTFVKLLSVSRPYISTMNKIVKVSENELQELVSVAVNSLKAGNIIAVPTDTIYGVAGLVQNSEAVDRLYSVKNRDYNKPVAISVADISDVYRWGQVTVPQALLAKLLPGPVTVVLNRTTDLNPELNPKTSLVGIRIPDHEFIREVARSCQEPLALTSANISSAQSTLRVEEFENLWPKLDKIFDDGMLGDTFHSRQGSTVVDLSKKGVYKIIRDGSSLKNTVQDYLTVIYKKVEQWSIMTNRTNGVTVTASEHYEGVNIQGLITNAVFGVFGVAISIMIVRVLYGVIKRRVRGCRTGSEYRRGSALSVHNGPPPTYSLLSIKTIPPTYSQACMIIGYHPSIGNISQSETSRNGSFLNVEYSNESFDVDFTATPSSNGDI